MTKQKAKELCILKWQYIVDNNGSNDGLVEKYPQLSMLRCNCAYCELYVNTASKKNMHCVKCPIKPSKLDYLEYGWGCDQEGHPYHKWTMNRTKINAQAMLNLVKRK